MTQFALRTGSPLGLRLVRNVVRFGLRSMQASLSGQLAHLSGVHISFMSVCRLRTETGSLMVRLLDCLSVTAPVVTAIAFGAWNYLFGRTRLRRKYFPATFGGSSQ